MSKLFVVAILSLGLAGCGFDTDGGEVYRTEGDFDPVDLRIQCGAESCPEAVGTLMNVQRETTYWGTSTSAQFCSATLIQSDRLATNDHCLSHNPLDETWFKTADTGSGSKIFRVAEILYRKRGAKSKLGQDVAFLRLETPAVGITPISLSDEKLAADMLLTFYSSNVSTGPSKYIDADSVAFIEKRQCRVPKASLLLPVPIELSPEVFAIEDCFIRSGNSGSGLLTEGGEILGVVQAVLSQDAVNGQNSSSADFGQSVDSQSGYAEGYSGFATQLRCTGFRSLFGPSRCFSVEDGGLDAALSYWGTKSLTDRLIGWTEELNQQSVPKGIVLGLGFLTRDALAKAISGLPPESGDGNEFDFERYFFEGGEPEKIVVPVPLCYIPESLVFDQNLVETNILKFNDNYEDLELDSSSLKKISGDYAKLSIAFDPDGEVFVQTKLDSRYLYYVGSDVDNRANWVGDNQLIQIHKICDESDLVFGHQFLETINSRFDKMLEYVREM